LFFEELRLAESRLASGLVRLGPAAREADIASAEERLGQKLPAAYRELLQSFDGADLFHESVVICGVGPQALRSLVEANAGPPPLKLHPEELIIGDTHTGDLLVIEPEDRQLTDEPRVFRLSPDAEERWLVGSSLPRFLQSTIAHQQLLYGGDGEFLLEAFEEDGEELTASYALRQAERALKKDPNAARYHYELGLALRRTGADERAHVAFAAAAALDPANPWPWFDLGRSERELGKMPEAAAAFECAAEAAAGGLRARLMVWAARSFFEAGERATAEQLLAGARQQHPRLGEELQRAADEAAEQEDEGTQALADARELARLVIDGLPASRKLPVLQPGPRRPRKR
jgi:tetratricopeptide (TPR) repeat protein